MALLKDRRRGDKSPLLIFAGDRRQLNFRKPAVDNDDFRPRSTQRTQRGGRITDWANDKPLDLPRLKMRQ